MSRGLGDVYKRQLRDTTNEIFVLDQIYLRTGFRVKVLSNSEHRFISYKAVAGSPVFEEMIKTSAAVVDVGGASVQITLFRDGKMITTQHWKQALCACGICLETADTP